MVSVTRRKALIVGILGSVVSLVPTEAKASIEQVHVDERPIFKLADYVLICPDVSGECRLCGSLHFVQLDDGEVVYPYTRFCDPIAWPKNYVGKMFGPRVSIKPAALGSVPYEWGHPNIDDNTAIFGPHQHEDFRWV